jgi:mannose-6-phosphate isomerase-like protein (cupin superfamily)
VSVRVNRADVPAEDHPYATIWRHLRRDGPHHVGVGIASFHPKRAEVDYDAIAEAHDVPEVHYVLSGEGVISEEGTELPVRSGDAVVTPPGRRHAIWATGDEPLVTVYVAVGLDAFEPADQSD